jgi:hypothetical protein
MFIIGWTPRGQARVSATATSRSVARLIHHPAEDVSSLSRLAGGACALVEWRLTHRPQHQEWGSSLLSAGLGRGHSYTHTYIQQACPCRPGLSGGAQGPPSQHPLHLELGAPAADYGYAPMAATPDILAR